MTNPGPSHPPSPLREVAEDIYLLRQPLPFALNHVNCYLLRDRAPASGSPTHGDTWTIVDAGLNRPELRDRWQWAWAELGIAPHTIRRIVLTHMHPDHFGLAGWLQQQTGATVYLSPREIDIARQTWLDDPTPTNTASFARYLHRAGVDPTTAGVIRDQQDYLRTLTYPHPRALVALHPGATIHMASRTWRAIHAPGHADGQLIFYSAADRLLLCGDHVLQRITPNIGLWPTTEPDPLSRYLQSLAGLAHLEVDLALPGHHAPLLDWRGRIAELQSHHAARLDAIHAAVVSLTTAGPSSPVGSPANAPTGATALAVSYQVFNYDRFSEHEVRFAVAETLAHLETLAEHGRLHRHETPEAIVYRP